ncbi:MAG: GNAT family N-acetyltransferase [Prevotellaceae bacterium]|jgi:predicted acetyltransferase|nr:GNAT family N-acetyltransferase [Prevotellaceae bacterium]
MANQEIRDHLVLKPVGAEYLDQYNELLRYVFQVTNRILQESGYVEDEIVKAKGPVLENADVFGWFDDDQLVSQAVVHPYRVNIHGRIFKMGGLTGVGTYPEYAGMGLMNDLIKVALKKMKDNGQLVSYLYPYSIPYYRKKGWEIMSETLSFIIKDSQLPKYEDTTGFVKRMPVDHKDVIRTYDKFARVNHGAMIRGKVEWEEYWRWENEEERTAAVFYDSKKKPQGFLLYWIADDIFHIKELIYLTQEARKGLWNFIHAHMSMVEMVKGNVYKNDPIAFLMEDSQIEETLSPYYMARIVDVAGFLKNYPFQRKTRPFCFLITDHMAEWNSGIFSVEWSENGKIKISRKAKGKSISLDIQTLTALLMCFRRPSYFHKVEYLNTDLDTLRLLEEIIPDEYPYFSDYF